MAGKEPENPARTGAGSEDVSLQKEIDRLKERLDELNEEKKKSERYRVELKTEASLVDGLRRNLGVLVGKMDLLARLAGEINSFNLDKIAKAAVEKTPKLVGADHASLYLFDLRPRGHERGLLKLTRQNNLRSIDTEINLRQRSNSLMAEAARKKSVLLIENIDKYEADRGIKFESPPSRKYETRSCIIIPLLTRNRLVGMLNLCDRADGKPFDPFHDFPVAKQVADMLATSVENCMLYRELREQARVDGLTELLNHKTFYDELGKEVGRCRRYDRRLSLFVFDIDHFKKFNDSYGHQAGDYILSEVASIVRSSIRAMDIPSRYGGDEFCVILPETGAEGAMVAAGRLAKATRAHEFHYEDRTFEVFLSVGVADLLPGESASDLVRRADEALLTAKRTGRDRIVCAES